MTKEEVDKIGQGRIWSGINAIDIGLVDVIGGVDKAIEIAVEMADLEHYRIIEMPKKKDPMQQIIEELTGEAKARIMQNELGESYEYYMKMNEALKHEGVLARMPFDIEIE